MISFLKFSILLLFKYWPYSNKNIYSYWLKKLLLEVYYFLSIFEIFSLFFWTIFFNFSILLFISEMLLISKFLWFSEIFWIAILFYLIRFCWSFNYVVNSEILRERLLFMCDSSLSGLGIGFGGFGMPNRFLDRRMKSEKWSGDYIRHWYIMNNLLNKLNYLIFSYRGVAK